MKSEKGITKIKLILIIFVLFIIFYGIFVYMKKDKKEKKFMNEENRVVYRETNYNSIYIHQNLTGINLNETERITKPQNGNVNNVSANEINSKKINIKNLDNN